jgi:hypothetical protein
MAWRYVYIIGDDGHIENRVDVVCEDEAKRCAQQPVYKHAIELWQEARMVASFQSRASISEDLRHSCPST